MTGRGRGAGGACRASGGMPPIASLLVGGMSMDYLDNGLVGLGIGGVLLAAGGVLARSWVAFSNAEWETQLGQRAVRRRQAALVLGGLAFLAPAVLNVLRG